MPVSVQDKDNGMVAVSLYDDTRGQTHQEFVSKPLGELFAYAHQWALTEQGEGGTNRGPGSSDEPTLTFSAMLAAMLTGADPLCAWLRMHLALRGVPSQPMTRSRSYVGATLPSRLTTTGSFRTAFAEARRLYDEAGCPEGGLGVRHFMAAYAVIPRYHLWDFARLRIDRRAWCLDLADQLSTRIPAEKALWVAYARRATPVPVLGFETDAPDGRDLLNVEREVEAFSMLIASRRTVTPLSVGVFGAWGSGKSFFMRRVRERVAAIAAVARTEARESKYHGQIAQIEFNAWHYAEGNLIASLVDHIFRNLRLEADDETDAILRQRGADVLRQIESAEQTVAERKQELEEAEVRVTAAKRRVEDINANIGREIAAKTAEVAESQSKLRDAQDQLGAGLTQLRTDIEAAVVQVPAKSVVALLEERLLGDPASVKAGEQVRGLVQDTKRASGRRIQLFWGLVVLGIAAIAAAAMRTDVWIKITSAVAALGGFAAIARTWLKKLDDIADSGERFQEKQAELAKKVTAEVTAAHTATLANLRAVADDRLGALEALNKDLEQLQRAPTAARLDLAPLELARSEAVAQHEKAELEIETKRQALERLTTGLLLEEFLNDRVSKDGYRRELTIFSRVRNDFERLSNLMSRAADEYYAGRARAAPAVTRIVLYIDDLDRCPADRVVEVLRMVHLLLAFPLFVCVVAVDPRWVTDCLRRAPGLVEDHESEASELTLEVGVRATPADYLEKIFQIPLWLRPIPAMQRPAVVRALLDRTGPRSAVRLDLPPMVGTEASARPNSSNEGDREASLPTPVRDTIDIVELEYLDQLRGLLDGNPRALKRFVNTYRLVKTALSDVELEVFLLNVEVKTKTGTVFKYRPYCMCMAKLAVLCTQRPRALAMVRHADQAVEGTMLGEWLESLAKKVNDQEFTSCLREALKESGDLEHIDFSTFALWLERTRRYSFYL
jgi:hypothetical protein